MATDKQSLSRSARNHCPTKLKVSGAPIAVFRHITDYQSFKKPGLPILILPGTNLCLSEMSLNIKSH